MHMFLNFLEAKLMPPMTKFAEQRHLRAIRNGIVATIPIILVGSFFLTFLNVPLKNFGIDWQKDVLIRINPNLPMNMIMGFKLTVGLMALYAAYGIGVALGKIYDIDATTAGLASTVAFLMSVMPFTFTPEMVETLSLKKDMVGQYLAVSSLGSASLFGAILYSLLAVEIVYFFKKHKITIKMPESVPEAISNSFAALFSIGAVILTVWIIRHVFNIDLNSIVAWLLSPLSQFLVGDNIFGVLLIVFLVTLLWSVGLHGVSLVGVIVRPFWEQAITANSDYLLSQGGAFAKATEIPHMYPEQFLQWYVWIGGSGATIGLVILLLFARSKFLKQMGRITFIPSIFNINEPVIFGLPIVMNPILIIPFIFSPIVMTLVAAAAQYFGFVNGMVTRAAAWTLPGPLGAWIATNFDWRAAILNIICILISIAIYFPFFKAYDHQLYKEEKSVESV